jgi:hypothetical protein
MSIFSTHTLQCPACATPMDFELVLSISADRRPDLRDAIVDGSFQRQPCPGCGTPFRVEPEFTYMDIGRRQYIGVWPTASRADWQACAEKTRAVFDDALGRNAPPEARRIGDDLDVRVVFGWPALVEKILARGAGIDDRTLEVAKLAVMRSGEETPLPGHRALRLVQVDETSMLFAWVGSGGEQPQSWRVPRQLIADIEGKPEAWKATRDSVASGDVVDFQRELLAA